MIEKTATVVHPIPRLKN